jgi:hypothetical protein
MPPPLLPPAAPPLLLPDVSTPLLLPPRPVVGPAPLLLPLSTPPLLLLLPWPPPPFPDAVLLFPPSSFGWSVDEAPHPVIEATDAISAVQTTRLALFIGIQPPLVVA